MFNGDWLNDDYELHQRRYHDSNKDELDILVARARVSRPHWYNALLSEVGERLILTGSSLKERNSIPNSSLPFQPSGG